MLVSPPSTARARRVVFRGTRGRDETGATLILALIFLVVVNVVIVSVVNWAGNDLNNTSKFTSALSLQAAANNANEVAVQFVQSNFVDSTLNAGTPQPCWPTTANVQMNGQSVDAWCSTYWNTTKGTRVVTISTCLSSVSASACAAAPSLQTILTIGDFNLTTGYWSCLPVLANALVATSLTTCGKTLTVNSWVFNAQPPTVVTVGTGGTATCGSGSKPVEISGSGFANVTSVYFLWVGGARTNQVFTVTSPLTVKSSGTIIDTCTPVAGSGLGPTNVVVTTPSGVAFGTTNYSY